MRAMKGRGLRRRLAKQMLAGRVTYGRTSQPPEPNAECTSLADVGAILKVSKRSSGRNLVSIGIFWIFRVVNRHFRPVRHDRIVSDSLRRLRRQGNHGDYAGESKRRRTAFT